MKLRPNRPESRPVKSRVPEHVPAAIGVFLLVPPGADDHVELLGEEHVDHRRSRLRVVGQVAVGHDVDVGIDVGEHAADDMALALLPFGADDGAGFRSDLARPVAAVVVVDVDGAPGSACAEAGHGRGDRRFLVVARQQHGNARRLRTVQTGDPRVTAQPIEAIESAR